MCDKILSIDIGVLHLGLLRVDVDSDGFRIHSFSLVDITKYTHNTVSVNECTLPHTKTFADWIVHMVQEYQTWFDEATVILLERQPPVGFVVIEQILFLLHRARTVLISPRSMHSHFQIQHLDYDARKQWTTFRCIHALDTVEHQLQFHCALSRQHDVADAFCLFLYWFEIRQRRAADEQRKRDEDQQLEERRVRDEDARQRRGETDPLIWLEEFRFQAVRPRNE